MENSIELTHFLQVCLVLAVTVAMVSAEHGFSSQYIHRHDGHHQEVSVHDKHGHHHVDYYVSFNHV